MLMFFSELAFLIARIEYPTLSTLVSGGRRRQAAAALAASDQMLRVAK